VIYNGIRKESEDICQETLQKAIIRLSIFDGKLAEELNKFLMAKRGGSLFHDYDSAN